MGRYGGKHETCFYLGTTSHIRERNTLLTGALPFEESFNQNTRGTLSRKPLSEYAEPEYQGLIPE